MVIMDFASAVNFGKNIAIPCGIVGRVVPQFWTAQKQSFLLSSGPFYFQNNSVYYNNKKRTLRP